MRSEGSPGLGPMQDWTNMCNVYCVGRTESPTEMTFVVKWEWNGAMNQM